LNITGSPAAEEAFFGIFISFNSVYLWFYDLIKCFESFITVDIDIPKNEYTGFTKRMN
jgi:hypothetical protein